MQILQILKYNADLPCFSNYRDYVAFLHIQYISQTSNILQFWQRLQILTLLGCTSKSGFFLLLSDPLYTFRRSSQGGDRLTKISSGGIAWPFYGPKGPKIGAEGAVLENFGKFSKKSGLKCNKNRFSHFPRMRLILDSNLLPHAVGRIYTSQDISFYSATTYKIRCRRKTDTACWCTFCMTYIYVQPQVWLAMKKFLPH